ncbi:MAG TPA: efflux RND transporter periplasmic adaptor subunit [Thermoanaerobaculia bacterium]|nr:efflux RND transporter periplasmic adaptor subunit [Thermoanaerobaculia bacterium]HUM30276.1 efflux RND transporter periplasmic adaptor subunit [Thermoanaerobaculia bacterium]HXK68428.1 efflux RND transporter periplasmic adaptor subunit [Thermoanaerobaculia bacterium]
MKRFWYVPLVILVVILGFVSLSGGEGPLTIQATRGAFVIDLEVTGELVAEKSITVSAPNVRTRLQVTYIIKDGALVKAGDILARFDPSELQNELDNSDAELKTIEAQIQQKEASLEALKRRYTLDLEDVKMQYELAKLDMVDDEGILPAKEIEKARLRLENAEQKYKETEKQLADEKEAALADLKVLQVQKRNKEQNLAFARKSYDDMILKAPADGLVVINEIWKGAGSGKVQEGDTVWRGYGIISLPDLKTLQVQAWLSEVDIGNLKEGQKTKIMLDAFPGETFTGQVSRVSSVGAKRQFDSDKKEFEIIVSLDRLDDRMKPGMTVRATIAIKTLKDVVSVPIEAVFTGKDGESVVYIKSFGGKKEQVVRTGERNATHIQILEGLEGGETLLIAKEDVE